MKTFHYSFGCLAACLLIGSSEGQAFQNLDFEQASISVPPPAQVSTSTALPGWTVWLNGTQSSTMLYDNETLDLWCATIYDSSFVYPVFSGRYSVLLRAGRDQFGTVGNAAISQIGTVPADAHSLLFSAKAAFGIDVSMNGSLLPVIPLATHPTFTTYGVDVSSLAGKTEDLRFTSFTSSQVWLDDIQFSTQVIPEPSTFALFAAGAAVFCGALHRRRK